MSRWMLLVPAALALTACQARGPDSAQIQQVAQYYVDHGGLQLNTASGRPLGRPCLQGVNLNNTVLGGLFGGPEALVDFIEKEKLAEVTRTQRSSGYVGVTIKPLPAYEKNWIGGKGLSFFCFGKFTVLKAEPVAGAEPVTAGAEQPYLVPGTKAYSTRITFRLDDLPGGTFLKDLQAMPGVQARDVMRPADYGRELTVVALLPEKTEHFNVSN